MIADLDDLVHVIARQPVRIRQSVGSTKAVGYGVDPIDGLRLAALETAAHRVGPFRLDTYNPTVGIQPPDRIRNTRDETAAADWYDQRIELIDLFDNFEAKRTGTESNMLPLERMHKEAALLAPYSLSPFEGFMRITGDDNLGTIRPATRNTIGIGRRDHDNLCVRAGNFRSIRRCDRMITRANRRHSGAPLFMRQGAERHQGTASLERAGVLEELELAVNAGVSAEFRLQSRAADDGRPDDSASEPASRRANFVDSRCAMCHKSA